MPLPLVQLVRHGETEWSRAGRHTGLTDLPLTTRGEANARRLAPGAASPPIELVLCSPLLRARRTCELAGFATVASIDADLVEWNYGDYEGRTTQEIRATRPQWRLFRDGCPGGESPRDVAARADRVVAKVRAAAADAVIFSSGHFLRMLAARWVGLEPEAGALFALREASLSGLGYEHDLNQPVVVFWDDQGVAVGQGLGPREPSP